MRKSLLLSALLVLASVASFATAATADDPWAVLSGVRKSLVEAGPTEASFTQTYIPAGFSSGEKENGRIALALPDCLRWDYQDPYPKSFLLCGGLAHAWSSQDKTGRRYRIDRRNEPGLDLLLLSLDDLRMRYQATASAVEGGRVEVSLTPKGKIEELADAVLTVDPGKQRLVAVAYHDVEGNLTRFEIRGYRDLARRGQFSPPSGIQWEEN